MAWKQGRCRTRVANQLGRMNKTEKAYATHLDLLIAAGEVHAWWFQVLKARVADDACWLTFDFMVQLPDGTLEIHDVKGGPSEDDAIVKMKVVATTLPFRVKEVRRAGTGWAVVEYTRPEA